MRRNVFKECLEHFKVIERPEAVLMIAGSSALTRIGVAWTQMPVARAKRLTALPSELDESRWAWLWTHCRFSRDELRARVPGADAKTDGQIDALIANRVIYPDGTANSFVEKYLRELVLRHFGKRVTRR